MSVFERLNHVYNSSEEVIFNDKSKFVFFSDCHRGDNSRADNFAPNSITYSSALSYYHANEYTYVEIGDGDELWENDNFSTLVRSHQDVYILLRRFYSDARMYMIWGNHDIYKKSKSYLRKNLYQYYDFKSQKYEPLFENINVSEGLILKHSDTGCRIFVVHGHQGDLLNDRLWPITRFLIRYVWRRIDALRYRNPISPAYNTTRANTVQSNIMSWVKNNQQMTISGHTHHAAYPKPGETPYFNDGCCVYSNYITCIEINDGQIMLVKWSRKPDEKGTLKAVREVIAGPEKIVDYFSLLET